MDGWARGEREDGGVWKVGRKVTRGGKKGTRSPAGGVEARARRSGMGGVKRAGNMQHKGEAQGTHWKGKRGAKEPGRWSTGKGEEEAELVGVQRYSMPSWRYCSGIVGALLLGHSNTGFPTLIDSLHTACPQPRNKSCPAQPTTTKGLSSGWDTSTLQQPIR